MALSFDPEQLPVLGTGAHLAPVDVRRLTPAALRERFACPPHWTPEIEGEPRFSERRSTAASVLIGLVMRDELTVLFTQRTDHLTDHPGQVSFPGGRAEPEDADAVATALREAHEEVGLAASKVDVIGALPIYATGTGFVVTPVVGLVAPDFDIVADPFEVAEVFEVPLRFLMDPSNHRQHAVDVAGHRREFFSMPWRSGPEAASSRRYFIWGATAAMLRNLYRFLSVDVHRA